MNLIFALVFHFCLSLISCRNVKYIDLDPNKDIFNKISSPKATDNQKKFSNQLRFLKVLPLDEWKNAEESKTTNKKSLPFTIIVATPESNLDIFENSELKPTTPEILNIIDEELKDMSKIQFEEYENDHGSKIHNDSKSEVNLKSIEEQIGELLLPMNTTSNNGEDDYLEINNEWKLTKPKIEDELNVENQLENEKDDDAEIRELLTDIMKAKIGNVTLHNKEESVLTHVLLEAKIDPKDATAYNPELREDSKQSNSSSEPNLNKHDHKLYKISLVLNKYVFIK